MSQNPREKNRGVAPLGVAPCGASPSRGKTGGAQTLWAKPRRPTRLGDSDGAESMAFRPGSCVGSPRPPGRYLLYRIPRKPSTPGVRARPTPVRIGRNASPPQVSLLAGGYLNVDNMGGGSAHTPNRPTRRAMPNRDSPRRPSILTAPFCLSYSSFCRIRRRCGLYPPARVGIENPRLLADRSSGRREGASVYPNDYIDSTLRTHLRVGDILNRQKRGIVGNRSRI